MGQAHSGFAPSCPAATSPPHDVTGEPLQQNGRKELWPLGAGWEALYHNDESPVHFLACMVAWQWP